MGKREMNLHKKMCVQNKEYKHNHHKMKKELQNDSRHLKLLENNILENQTVYNNAMFSQPLTFSGCNLFDVKHEITQYEQINETLKKKNQLLAKELSKERTKINTKLEKYKRQTCYSFMELSNYFYQDKLCIQMEKEDKDINNKLFLKRLNLLPDDVLNVICSYFTYETKSTILIYSLYPMQKMIQSFSSKTMKMLIYTIYNDYVMINKHRKLIDSAKKCWSDLGRPSIIYDIYAEGRDSIVSIKIMRTWFLYLMKLFHQYNSFKSLYEIQRLIIYVNSLKTTN
jgi:hypothetical protein